MEREVSAFEIYKKQQKSNKQNSQPKVKKNSKNSRTKNKKQKTSNDESNMDPTTIKPAEENVDNNNQLKNKKKLKNKNNISFVKLEQCNGKSENQESASASKKLNENLVKKREMIKNKKRKMESATETNSSDKETSDNGSDEEIPMLVKIPLKKAENERKTNIHKKKLNAELEAKKQKYQNTSDDTAENVSEGYKVFKWLIAPLKLEMFFQDYWEKEAFFVARNKPFYYEHILTTHGLDRMLRDHTLYYTRNVDVVSYKDGVKEVFNQEGRAIPAVLWDYYSNGCSIRILNPQTYNSEIHVLIAALQEYFGNMVGANIYLTPPGSQGFAPHYDDIEAFVIQLEGRKHWKLYMPPNEDVLARNSSPNLNREDIGSPFMEVILNAGDILYFPRGTIHEGHTEADSHSLHITVSVYQHTAYVDLLEKILPNALQRAATEDLEFRKGLPLNYLKYTGLVNKDNQSDCRQNLIEKLKTLITSLTKYMDVDEGADLMGKKFMHDCLPPVLSQDEIMLTCRGDGDFMSEGIVKNRAEFDLDTNVRLLRYHCIRAVAEDNTIKIYYCTDNAKVYHGEEEQWMEIDEALLPAIKHLQNNYPAYVRIEDLPIEGDAEKIQIISDMWEKGLIKTSSPLSIVDSDVESDEEESDEDDDLSVSDE